MPCEALIRSLWEATNRRYNTSLAARCYPTHSPHTAIIIVTSMVAGMGSVCQHSNAHWKITSQLAYLKGGM